jgi:hypothetical protein
MNEIRKNIIGSVNICTKELYPFFKKVCEKFNWKNKVSYQDSGITFVFNKEELNHLNELINEYNRKILHDLEYNTKFKELLK